MNRHQECRWCSWPVRSRFAARTAWAQPAGDPFVCYKSRSLGTRGGLPAFMARKGDVVIDTFSTARPEDQHRVDLPKSIGLCAPASIEGSC